MYCIYLSCTFSLVTESTSFWRIIFNFSLGELFSELWLSWSFCWAVAVPAHSPALHCSSSHCSRRGRRRARPLTSAPGTLSARWCPARSRRRTRRRRRSERRVEHYWISCLGAARRTSGQILTLDWSLRRSQASGSPPQSPEKKDKDINSDFLLAHKIVWANLKLTSVCVLK